MVGKEGQNVIVMSLNYLLLIFFISISIVPKYQIFIVLFLIIWQP